jgi:uncharacterized protein YebE (UPF0316 family)
MEQFFSQQPILGAVIIFALRVADMSMATLRMLMVMRGKKLLVWVLGFFQAGIFVVAITSVLVNLDNVLNIIAYAAGFATGNVVGMYVEGKLAVGFTDLRIISPHWGSAIVEKLRAEGYAVTEIPARGKDGTVTLLNCSVRRRNVTRVDKLIREIDEDAFITAEDLRPVRRGFWRA